MAVTLVPMLGVALYRTILTAAEKPRVFLKVTLAMLPLNAAADYLLMTGAGPLPAFGPAGSGLGSLLVATASLAILVWIGRQGRTARPSASTGAASPRRCASACRSASRPWPRSGSSWRRPSMRRPSAQPTSRPTRSRCERPASPTPSRPRCSRPRWFAPRAPRRSAIPFFAGPSPERTCPRADRRRAAPRRARGRSPSARRPLLRRRRRRPGGVGSRGGPPAAPRRHGVRRIPSAVAAGLLRGRKVARAPMLFALIGHWGIGAPIGLYLCETMGRGVSGLWIGLTAGTLFTAVLTLRRLLKQEGPGLAPLLGRRPYTTREAPVAGDSSVRDADRPRRPAHSARDHSKGVVHRSAACTDVSPA